MEQVVHKVLANPQESVAQANLVIDHFLGLVREQRAEGRSDLELVSWFSSFFVSAEVVEPGQMAVFAAAALVRLERAEGSDG